MIDKKDVKIMALLRFFFSWKEAYQLFEIILDDKKDKADLERLLHELVDYDKELEKYEFPRT